MESRRAPCSITAFFPLYNDAPTAELMVERARSVLERVSDDWEIVLVEDCSPDNVGEIADRLAAEDSRVRVVHHERNRGYGGALRSGFAAATKQLVFYTDGDAQYDPREMTALLERIEGADMVNGYKVERADRLVRKVLGRVYHVAVKSLFGLTVRDVDCDFRLIRREVLDCIELESDSGVICAEMMAQICGAGFKIAEVPVHHYPRMAGESQFFRFGRIMALLRGLARQWVRLVLFEGKYAGRAKARRVSVAARGAAAPAMWRNRPGCA